MLFLPAVRPSDHSLACIPYTDDYTRVKSDFIVGKITRCL